MQKIWYKIRYNFIELDPFNPVRPNILITLISLLGIILLIKILFLFGKAF